jgi:urease accessory protein
MMAEQLLTLLHLCDSLFPLGAFAHSDGLEAATVSGEVATPDDLREWMNAIRDETLARCDGPAVRMAWTAMGAGALDDLFRIDDDVHALRPSGSARRASRAMGTRLLTTWQHLRPQAVLAEVLGRSSAVQDPSTGNLAPAAPDGGGSGVQSRGTGPRRLTLPVAFGVVCAASEIPLRSTVSAFFYTRLAATVSAAMRLMPLGQHEAHTVLARSMDGIPAAVDVALTAGWPSAFTPALDIAAMSHQYVHSRLFRS